MSTSFSSAAQTQLLGGTIRPAIFFRMALNDGSVIRLWGGVGDFSLPANAFDAAAQTYRGLGQINDIPVMQQLLGGAAERVSFTMSGVDATTAALADSEANLVRGAQIQVGLVLFDNGWQPLTITGSSIIRWCAEYEADSPGGAHDGTRWTISLSAASAFSGRRRSLISRYTPQDQRKRSATDAFCDKTPQISVGTSILFGP